MLQLNYRDPRPIYEQVKSEFRRLILSGALARGDRRQKQQDEQQGEQAAGHGKRMV